MPAQTDVLVSPEEYLAREREGDQLEKSEYRNGKIVPMPGASRQHVLIVTNIVFALERQLRTTDCLVFSTDLRVRTGEGTFYTYPDVAVVCDEPQFADDQHDTLLNPVLLVEVLSESTRDYDRGEKFARYRTIDALEEYVLVAQDEPHVEHFARQAEGRWLLSETSDPEATIELDAIGARLALADIYHKVEPGS